MSGLLKIFLFMAFWLWISMKLDSERGSVFFVKDLVYGRYYRCSFSAARALFDWIVVILC